MAVNIPEGTTITHAVLTGNIVGFDGGGQTMETYNGGHLGTTGLEPLYGSPMWTADEFTVTVQFSPTAAPTFSSTASDLVITFPDNEVWTATALCTNYKFSGSKGGGVMEGQFTFKRTEDWAIT